MPVARTLGSIQVKNTGETAIRIDARTRLGSLIDYDELDCYSAVPDKEAEGEVGANDEAELETEQILLSKETKLANGITVYGTPGRGRRRREST